MPAAVFVQATQICDVMGDQLSITVPCDLRYRDALGALIKHVCTQLERESADPGLGVQVLSAYNEAFNNLALHAYDQQDGSVELLLEVDAAQLALVLRDRGQSFDFDAVGAPDLHALPESGLGIFIIRSFMNEVRYEPKIDGETNVLRMVKYLNAHTALVRTDPAQGTFDDA